MGLDVERYSTTIDIYSHRRVTPKLRTAYLCFKIILLVANLIFMIFGCVLIGVGTYALNTQANALIGQTLPSGLVVMGVFVLVLAAIGAISAWKESILGLAIYLTLLLAITIILFSIGVAIVVKKNQAGSYIIQAWMNAPDDVRGPVQTALDCCGLMAYNDNYAVLPCPNSTIPEGDLHRGCYDPLNSAFNSAYQHAGSTGIAFSVIMGCGIVLVVFLVHGIRQKQTEEQVEKVRQQNHANHGLTTDDVEGGTNLDEIDAGAASMFDRQEQPHQTSDAHQHESSMSSSAGDRTR